MSANSGETATQAHPENANRFAAALRIFGPKLDPSRITQALELDPTRTRQPDPEKAASSRIPSRFYGSWSLDSPLPRDRPLADHITWLLQQIEPRAPYLRAAIDPSVRVDFFLGVFCEESQCGFEFSNLMLARVVALGAIIVFDIYGGGHSERVVPGG